MCLLDIALLQIVYGQIEPRLGHYIQQSRHHSECSLAVAKHHHVVTNQISTEGSIVGNVLDHLLGHAATEETKAIAGLQIDCYGAVAVLTQIHFEHLLRHVVVVQLIEAQGQIDIDGQEVLVVDQHTLVHIDGLLVVSPHVVHGGQAQLLLHTGRWFEYLLQELSPLLIVAQLVGQMKEQTLLEWRVWCIGHQLLRLLVQTQIEHANGHIEVQIWLCCILTFP